MDDSFHRSEIEADQQRRYEAALVTHKEPQPVRDAALEAVFLACRTAENLVWRWKAMAAKHDTFADRCNDMAREFMCDSRSTTNADAKEYAAGVAQGLRDYAARSLIHRDLCRSSAESANRDYYILKGTEYQPLPWENAE
jgi:hypothetical protein